MERRPLTPGGPTHSAVGLHAARAAALAPGDLEAALEAAFEAGVDHVHVADADSAGAAERALGRALARLGQAGERVRVCARFGRFAGTAGHPFEAGHFLAQIAQSRCNLGRECLDLCTLEHADLGPNNLHLAGIVEALEALLAAQTVRAVGLRVDDLVSAIRLLPRLRPAVVLVRSHLLEPGLVADPRFRELCAQHGCRVLVEDALAGGRLVDQHPPPAWLAALGSDPAHRRATALAHLLEDDLVTAVLPGHGDLEAATWRQIAVTPAGDPGPARAAIAAERNSR